MGASTSFANPAVTLARTVAATLIFRWLVPSLPKDAASVVVPHPTQEAIFDEKKRVLILCTGYSARSQMAEGLLRHDAGDRCDVESAMTGGASPADMEIVISPKAAAVTGVAQNPNTGNRMPGAMVVLMPQDQQRTEQQTYYKFVVSDQNGASSLTTSPQATTKPTRGRTSK